MSNDELVQILDDIIEINKLRIHNESVDNHAKLQEWYDKLSKHTGLKTELDISKKFHQLDSEGNWTGGLINKIDHSYWKKTNELIDKARESKDWLPYFKFLDENTFSIF